MTDQLYIAVKDNSCVVTDDPNDSDIPAGANAVPVSRFNVSDYERLRANGVTDFAFNSNNSIWAQSDSAPKTLSDYILLAISIMILIGVAILIAGAYAP